MKNRTINYSKITFLLALVFMVTMSCERDISDEVEFATFPNTGEIFTDTPIGMGSNFYFPFSGSKPTAWTVDESEGYESEASMRFDVPNANDPEGSYAGAIFRIDGDGSGRDLSDFDALTFWAKGSEARTINNVGFGQDFLENKYQVKVKGALQLTTNWVKYIIPIPDPSKLIQERGMFWYAEGPNDDGTGWTFWIDELKFEKLGTIGSPRPEINNGIDGSIQTFIGTDGVIPGSNVTFNLPSGFDVEISTAASYYDWTSSEPSVVAVEDGGNLPALSQGTSVITATLAGVQAEGSLTVEVLGEFEAAPIPPARDSANVISIFSDAYNNVPVDYYNGYFLDGFQTTQGQNDIYIDGDNIISYTDLNFVAIGTFLDVAPVNAFNMTHIHVDINVREVIDSGDYIKLQLHNDVGGTETFGFVTIDGSQLASNEWVSLDIPLDDFTGLAARNQLGLIFFISDATISEIYVDNVYYYRE